MKTCARCRRIRNLLVGDSRQKLRQNSCQSVVVASRWLLSEQLFARVSLKVTTKTHYVCGYKNQRARNAHSENQRALTLSEHYHSPPYLHIYLLYILPLAYYHLLAAFLSLLQCSLVNKLNLYRSLSNFYGDNGNLKRLKFTLYMYRQKNFPKGNAIELL